jgi:two-component system phosphate regulon sensor histidine kinase PhoR
MRLHLKKQHRLFLLIVACLLLLGVSQGLWLQKVWKEARAQLLQEANFLFHTTGMALQDSLVQRNMVRNGFNPDSTDRFPPSIVRNMIRRERRSTFSFDFKTDSQQRVELPAKKEDMQVAIFITYDSLNEKKHPDSNHLLQLRTHTELSGAKMRVFEFENDSISTAEFQTRYAMALDSAGLPSTFSLTVGKEPHMPGSDEMRTEPVPSGLLQPRFFSATLLEFDAYLWRKTLPSALFSLLVFGLTTLAFLLIFNNLRRQEKLSEQKNAFVGNLTHELKTPLTTVGVALEALRDFDVLRNPEQAREYLAISQLELDRLGLLVDKVLRISQLDSIAPVLRKEPLDLQQTVQQVLNALSLQIKTAAADVQFNTDQQGPYEVSGDRLHLSGVVFNLIDNALKYRRDPCEIQVSLHKNSANVVLQVRDNGTGIAPEYLSKIFEKFFRVPTGNTHNVKGHGLGLSYAAQVLAHHGGSIRAESRSGAGSLFTVEIPLATHPPNA